MRVIFLKDIKNIGKSGDVKNVSDGYARNFLIPNGFAKLATKSLVKDAEIKKESSEEKIGSLQKYFEEVQEKTADSPMTFQIKVGDKGEVFGSVSAGDIEKKLLKTFPKLKDSGLKIKNDHLREVGQKKIEVGLGRGVGGEVTIEIQPQQP